MRKPFFSAFYLFSGALGLLLWIPLESFGQEQNLSDYEHVVQAVTYESVQSKIAYLASDEMRGRDTPSPEQERAAQYLASELRSYGVSTVKGQADYFQPVQLKEIFRPTFGSLTAGDSVFQVGQNMLALRGNAVDLKAKVIFLEYGDEEDFKKANVKGKIVVTRLGTRGEPNINRAFRAGRQKQARATATENGALGLIELYSSTVLPWNIIQSFVSGPSMSLNDEPESTDDFFYGWMDDTAGQLAGFFKNFGKKAHLVIGPTVTRPFEVKNVVGFVEGTDPELKREVVIYSAHYDHVGIGAPDATGDSIYNGTRDNAIGTVTVLEAARSIAANPLKRSALFIFFTAEEKGLLGSEWYADHPLLPLRDVVMCFNSDNAGYNDTTKATIIGLSRTTASEQLQAAGASFGLEVNDDPAPEQNLFDRSDQVSFARKGVPAIMFTMGITGFDDEVLKYYHQASDSPDSVDYQYLLKFSRAYVMACRLIGNMEERPYWTPGDKYYENGEELYRDN